MLEVLSRAAFDSNVVRLDRRFASHHRWTLVTAEYPELDVILGHPKAAPLRLRFECTDWDDLPPSIALLDADGRFLTTAPPSVGNVFNSGAHPSTRRPFVCMRGAREYHIHPSHVADRWENYRNAPGMDLPGILYQLWRAWKRAVA